MADLRDYNDLPCQDPERMDDWFIEAKAKLEADEEAVVIERVTIAFNDNLAEYRDLTHNEQEILLERKIAQAIRVEEAALRKRRREAVQSCFLDCPMVARLLCLDEGIKNPEWGIWGGYPETERRKIAQAVKAKATSTRRAAQAIIAHEDKRPPRSTQSDQLAERGGAEQPGRRNDGY